MQTTTITVAGTEYERVTDLTTLTPGDRLRQHHENHTTSHLTVLAPYGRHGHSVGVLCRREGRETWNTVLTTLSAEYGPVWRVTA
jgi:hypothetical protein